MITKIKIQGYRIYGDFSLLPNKDLNILVGGNDAGKSTLMEAIGLGLNGRIGGRSAQEELNPYWFNKELVNQFLEDCAGDDKPTLPEILSKTRVALSVWIHQANLRSEDFLFPSRLHSSDDDALLLSQRLPTPLYHDQRHFVSALDKVCVE